MKTKRRDLFKYAGAGVAALAVPGWLSRLTALAAEQAEKPNIIFILADDLGLGNVGAYGGPFKTPNLDRLAREGLRFSQCYSMPVCGPSRCVALTGRYPFRTGLIDNSTWKSGEFCPVDPKRDTMIQTVMKQAGYVTACVGKWGQIAWGPGEWGFDEHLSYYGWGGGYWRKQTKGYFINGKKAELIDGEYLPDIQHRFIVDFLAKHKAQPFFLYYPMTHPHEPFVPTPDSKPGADRDRLYADNIEYMDKLVGQLVAELDRLHLREKTLVIFSGDNGTDMKLASVSTVNGRRVNGAKLTMEEGGSRVPLIANWPGVVPAGKVLDDLVDFSDFFTTFADLGGAKLPAGVKLDGRSLAPQLRGGKGSPREWVFVQMNGRGAAKSFWYVRSQKFKLNEKGELYDMAEAPFAEKPVTNEAERLKLQAVLDELNPGSWTQTRSGLPAGTTKKRGKKEDDQ
ncbi:MAG: sulfatase-like hydrolase/transferase [bacterium]